MHMSFITDVGYVSKISAIYKNIGYFWKYRNVFQPCCCRQFLHITTYRLIIYKL